VLPFSVINDQFPVKTWTDRTGNVKLRQYTNPNSYPNPNPVPITNP